MSNKKDLKMEDLEKVSGGLGNYNKPPQEPGYWYWITYVNKYRGQDKQGGYFTAEARDLAMNLSIANIQNEGGHNIKTEVGYNK